ncbi:hypothetical protein [Guptibacillus algicola]|uniref:hypothetical protein n=1 Tax=Guptibacillus algicola TaxID=225844 RepID=UPI001CD6943A|nr:hypothetical protein [Alkalihalobacillus algicola]MCA0987594.1 hypothetical protein [Alkalihalobacillus algicola]
MTACSFEVSDPSSTVLPEDERVIEEGDRYLGEIISLKGNFLDIPDSIEEERDAVEVQIVSYDVEADDLTSHTIMTDEEAYLSFAKETDKHRDLWYLFSDLIPSENREMVKEFLIFTDGRDDVLGYVEPLDNSDEWVLAIDYEDTVNEKDFYYTLVHEYGHLLTLKDDQIDQEDLADEDAVEEAFMACDYYFAFNGCSRQNSYMNAFFETFWADYYDEWLDQDVEWDEEAQVAFFEKYPNHFSTDYAATHPEEDIAEAWTHFIFSTKPTGETTADQKIAFFYQFSELVELRKNILLKLSDSLKEQ